MYVNEFLEDSHHPLCRWETEAQRKIELRANQVFETVLS